MRSRSCFCNSLLLRFLRLGFPFFQMGLVCTRIQTRVAGYEIRKVALFLSHLVLFVLLLSTLGRGGWLIFSSFPCRRLFFFMGAWVYGSGVFLAQGKKEWEDRCGEAGVVWLAFWFVCWLFGWCGWLAVWLGLSVEEKTIPWVGLFYRRFFKAYFFSDFQVEKVDSELGINNIICYLLGSYYTSSSPHCSEPWT